MANDTGLPTDLICLGEASALLPGRTPGRRISTQTIRRWIELGKLPGWRRGRDLCVSRSDVLRMVAAVKFKERVNLKPATARTEGHNQALAYLKARGLD